MRRVYFLAPDVDSARKTVDDLHARGVDDRHIHLVASSDTDLGALPEADALENSDLFPALKRGAALGGTTGLLAGLTAVSLPTGLVLGGGAVLALTAAGAGTGAWASSLIGAGLHDREATEHEAEIRKGAVLLMVDVPREEVDSYRELVRSRHPEAEIEDRDIGIPPH